jgi:hypothetical protein
LTQIFVVVEIGPEFGILSEELHYREALVIEPLVHVAATLKQHYFNLALRRLEGKETSQDRSEDGADYSR